jgi:nucleoside-diphosphate-sugar epimerase
MKILLTGHRGFIGSKLYDELSKAHDVIGIDLLDGNNILTCDFPQDIDLVIHLAGRSGVRESLNNPGAYWMNNVEASRRLFERYKGVRILYASSSSAYEPDLNPYAASKYILEELAARYDNTLGMRFHTVYSDTPRKGMFFDKLFNNKLEYVTRHYRDFVHINDVIDAIKILIAHERVKGIIDIGSGDPIRVQDIAPDLPIRLNTPHEREITCANLEKIKTLGYKPKYMIKEFLTNKELEVKL